MILCAFVTSLGQLTFFRFFSVSASVGPSRPPLPSAPVRADPLPRDHGHRYIRGSPAGPGKRTRGNVSASPFRMAVLIFMGGGVALGIADS